MRKWVLSLLRVKMVMKGKSIDAGGCSDLSFVAFLMSLKPYCVFRESLGLLKWCLCCCQGDLCVA